MASKGGIKKAKYDAQFIKTAKNKIRRIQEHHGDPAIIEKYQNNPKWKSPKRHRRKVRV